MATIEFENGVIYEGDFVSGGTSVDGIPPAKGNLFFVAVPLDCRSGA
jgi:hypothetical protein